MLPYFCKAFDTVSHYFLLATQLYDIESIQQTCCNYLPKVIITIPITSFMEANVMITITISFRIRMITITITFKIGKIH